MKWKPVTTGQAHQDSSGPHADLMPPVSARASGAQRREALRARARAQTHGGKRSSRWRRARRRCGIFFFHRRVNKRRRIQLSIA
jgi:hypothetical protein